MSGPSVFLSAGEASGDRHAAAVAHALSAAAPGTQLLGIGGACLRAAGTHLIHDLASLQAVGLVEAAATLPAHVRALRAAARVLRAGAVDLAVLVDYPGFHHRLARLAHRRGIPVLHYIAPQLWAWGHWRVGGLRRTVDRLAVILPFEEAFFREHGVAARFVGHPLLEAPVMSRAAARAQLGLNPDEPVLGLFPGSRPAERARLWPVFRHAAVALRSRWPDLRVLVASPPSASAWQPPDGSTVGAPAPLVAAAADAAIAKSGTTSLELALAGTPHVLAYRVHPVTYAAARRAVRVPWIGLVNLILGRPVVPEFLQHRGTPAALAAAADELLDPRGSAAGAQRVAFTEAAARLGTPGAARRVADLGLELVA